MRDQRGESQKEKNIETWSLSLDKDREKQGERKERQIYKKADTREGERRVPHLGIRGGPSNAPAKVLEVPLSLAPEVLLYAVPELALGVSEPQVLDRRHVRAAVIKGKARPGEARQSKAKEGRARQSKAKQGKARQGKGDDVQKAGQGEVSGTLNLH